jgi:hypothetical protein
MGDGPLEGHPLIVGGGRDGIRQAFRKAAGAERPGPRLWGVASPEAKNLEAISKAIDQHNSSCPFPAAEVRMNPFEVERLGWEHIRGLPVIPDGEIGTGRFRIVCSRDVDDSGLEITEAVGQELETVAPSQN